MDSPQVESEQRFAGPFRGDICNKVPEEGYHWLRGHELDADQPSLIEWELDNDVQADTEWVRSVEGWAIGQPHFVGRGTQFVRIQNLREVWPVQDNPALFKEFAELDPLNRDEILRFANRYGLLGIGNHFFPIDYPPELLVGLPAEAAADLVEYATGRRAWSNIRCDERRRLPKLPLRAVGDALRLGVRNSRTATRHVAMGCDLSGR